MKLTDSQNKAVDIILKRYEEGRPYTCLAGVAGVGKSTVISFVVEALKGKYGIKDDQFAFVAPTGKACEVMRAKGNKNTQTIHKLLYSWRPVGPEKFTKLPVPELDTYQVIFVDEVSMVPKEMWDLLMEYHVYVVATGDPEQLPPIRREDDNGVLHNPHIFLSEVMRQALDSDIVQLSMDIRLKNPYKAYGKDAMILRHNDLTTSHLVWADQIICATNATKNKINMTMRKILNKGDNPEKGDKIICLKNEWNIADTNQDMMLTNGTIGEIIDFYKNDVPIFVKGQRKYIPTMYVTFKTDDGHIFKDIPVDFNELKTGVRTLTEQEEWIASKNKKEKGKIPCSFNYGYAITCHKSQGSEYGKVLVIEENFPLKKDEHRRWLYTAVTRGAEKVVLVRK